MCSQLRSRVWHPLFHSLILSTSGCRFFFHYNIHSDSDSFSVCADKNEINKWLYVCMCRNSCTCFSRSVFVFFFRSISGFTYFSHSHTTHGKHMDSAKRAHTYNLHKRLLLVQIKCSNCFSVCSADVCNFSMFIALFCALYSEIFILSGQAFSHRNSVWHGCCGWIFVVVVVVVGVVVIDVFRKYLRFFVYL